MLTRLDSLETPKKFLSSRIMFHACREFQVSE